MHFQAYVYFIFVYRFVYVDMSTRSSQINHLSLESLSLSLVCVGGGGIRSSTSVCSCVHECVCERD